VIVIAPSRDINGTRNDCQCVWVYFCALPPKRSLSLSEDKCSPCSEASIPAVTILLEMILGEPNSTGGGRNEVFIQLLMGHRRCWKSFIKGENKRAVKGQIGVVSRPVSLGSFTV